MRCTGNATSPHSTNRSRKNCRKIKQNKVELPKLTRSSITLNTSPLDISLDVSPGDFQAAFTLASYDPSPDGLGQDLVFSLHELDRNPSIIKRGTLTYPSHLKRRGLEGEVKLLVQIDEKGKVSVIEVVSASHPDFAESSKTAAESSVYEPPMRNGEPVNDSILSSYSVHLTRKINEKHLFFSFLLIILSLFGKHLLYQLTSDFWNNPTFANFMGDYGFRSEVEPRISKSESFILREVIAKSENNWRKQLYIWKKKLKMIQVLR